MKKINVIKSAFFALSVSLVTFFGLAANASDSSEGSPTDESGEVGSTICDVYPLFCLEGETTGNNGGGQEPPTGEK